MSSFEGALDVVIVRSWLNWVEAVFYWDTLEEYCASDSWTFSHWKVGQKENKRCSSVGLSDLKDFLKFFSFIQNNCYLESAFYEIEENTHKHKLIWNEVS